MYAHQVVLQRAVGGEAAAPQRPVEAVEVDAVVVGGHGLGHQAVERVDAPADVRVALGERRPTASSCARGGR